jgi:O-antigen/teichoic acid export membrane protein
MAFFVFGSQFIKIWAGEQSSGSYYITFMFFVALFIPLIQNMGITILQARNQMKFRCILYIIIAFVSLIGQIILSKEYGAYGCAISISAALIIGQGIIMNIYYKRKQGLDITKFWKEILKMSISPCVIAVISFMIFKRLEIQSYTIFFLCATVFSAVYIPCFWFFSMNDYERQLIKEPIKKLLRKK